MSNETKVGILAIIAIAIMIWGYKFLKGQNILTSSQIFYVEYEDADMLAASSPVVISGFQIGVVADMYLKPEDMKTIVTVLDIERGIKIPKDAVAKLASLDITGGKGVIIEFDKPCSGDDCAQSGDYLVGDTKSLLGSMIPQEELERYLKQLGGTVGEIYDTLNQRLTDPNAKGIGKTFQDFQATMTNLNATTGKLDRLLGRSSGTIEETLKNIEQLTAKLNVTMVSIDSVMNNTAEITGQLKEADLAGTITKTSNNANEAMEKLKGTLEGADKALAEVTSLLNSIKAGEGTMGKLFTDEELYDKLTAATAQLQQFLADFESAPYRYMPLKSRNKVKRYDKKDGREDD